MSETNAVLLKIKPVWESTDTFKKVDQLVNGAKKKVNELNRSYSDQKKSIGQLKEKIVEWRGEQEKSFRTDHIKKYNQLIDGAKRKIEEIENTAKTCGEKTQSIFKSVFSANLATQALGIAKNAVINFTKDSMDAYQKHNVALTQLQQVMKNTMNASKWDVQDIVAVTKAQEKLGVVSSNVQLAGAKELGTYIKKKESLEKLIPTMNDMLAHQYGLNASQENAQGIAQMMGKVLEGQVNALSRNGYSFTDAQEKILKYGNESERVAVLAEVIAQSVEGVNEALAATPEGKAKQVAMEYDEMKIKAGELATKLKGDALQSLQKFTLALYNNRNTVVGVTKVVTAATLSWGVYKVTVAAVNSWTTKGRLLFVAKTQAMKLFTGQLKLATIQQAAFNTVSKMNPIGAVIGLATAAASALLLFKKRNKEATDSLKDTQEAAKSYYAQERSQLDMIFAKLRQTNPKSEERKRLVKEISDLYPELNKQTLNDITNTNNLSAAYDVLIKQIEKRAKAKAIEQMMVNAYEKSMEVDYDLSKSDSGEQYTIDDNGKKVTVALPYLNTDIYRWLNDEKNKKKTLKLNNKEYTYDELKEWSKAKSESFKANQMLKDMNLGATYTSSNSSDNTNTNSYTSTASDSITGGGKQVKNFYINIDSLIRENTNMFQSSKDDPATAQDFMGKLSEALQTVVNDVNYAAA